MILYHYHAMKLYYGSKTYFNQPTFGIGNPSNDYGVGFYMTDSKAMAELWASQNPEGGYVLSFDIDLNHMRILKLADYDELSVLKWIALLAKHRFPYQSRLQYRDILDWLVSHFDSPINDYDIVIGYRADDSYFNYSVGFLAGDISLETLQKAMRLGKLGLQYVLISKASFGHLTYLGAEEVAFKTDYANFRAKTLSEYNELLRMEDRFTNTFIGELMKKYGK